MAELRLLSIITRLNVGGPAAILTTMLDHLDAEVVDHTVATGRLDDGEADWLALRAPHLLGDPRIVHVPQLQRAVDPRRDLAAYRALRRLIRRVQPDVVHTHTAKAGMLGRLAAFHEDVPAVVHTFHGHTLHSYFGPARTRVFTTIERRLARRTDLLVAVGEQVRDDLLAARIGTPERYTVLPPAVSPPPPVDRGEARARFGLDDDQPVIAWVGRLAPVKRPDRMVAVADLVALEHPDLVVLVAGDGEPGVRAALADSVQRADVRFLGWVDDVASVYAACDLVLLTSDNEGMPVTLLEAAGYGRPFVSSGVGSVSKLAGSHDLVSDSDPSNLARAVVDSLSHNREVLQKPFTATGTGPRSLDEFRLLHHYLPYDSLGHHRSRTQQNKRSQD